MSETSLETNPVFIDVAANLISSEQEPMAIVIRDSTVVNEPIAQWIKIESGASTTCATSPLSPFLEIQSRRIRCKECTTYTAENEEKMLRHVRKIHRGENPYQCYMCDYSTYNNVLFEEHVRIHQGIKPFKCTHCPYRSVSKKNTKKHELIHRPDNPNKCQKCDFVARHFKSLQRHMNTEHAETTDNYYASISQTQCQHCKRKFSNLEHHLKSRLKCSMCPPGRPTLLCNKSLLKNHLITVHGQKTRQSKNDFTCAICEWSSNIRPKILLHLIHHPNQPVDESVVDLNILKQCGIIGQGW